MKRQIANLLGVFGLLLMAACANAQDVNLKANIPFDFVVGKATLPAGAYSIQSIDAARSMTLLIKGNEGKVLKLVSPNVAQALHPSEKTRLLFHRYGDQYFLSQIWMGGEAIGRQFRMSRRESELASNLQSHSEDVIVMAALR